MDRPGESAPIDRNKYLVNDVRVAGASLIVNYRSLFAQEIQNGGIDGLIKSLVDKNSGKIQPLPK